MSRTEIQLRNVFRRSATLALALGMSLAGPQPVVAAEPADFTVSPQAPLAGQTVTFTATDTKPSDVVRWDFQSDGAFDATGTTVQHVYATAGQRTVLMRVVREGSQPRNVRKTVRVGAAPAPPPAAPPASANRPPLAAFTFYPRQPLAGDSVEFVSTSSDPDSPIAGHAWDLDGDGQFDDSHGITAAHSFSAPGHYTVALRVTDAKGAADVESRTVAVGARLASASSGLGLMSPFPVVRIIGRSGPRGVRIKLLAVRSAPRGAKVTVRCRGKGCPRRRQSRIVRFGRLRLRSFERLLGTGVRVQVFVTQPGKIGKYTSFKTRSMRPPLRRDLCLHSVSAKPKPCPSS